MSDAEAVCRRTLSGNPRDADCWHLLAVVLHQRGQQPAALECIDHALTIKPQEAQYHNTRGAILGAGGHRHAALGAFERALALSPSDGSTRQNVGAALLELGRIDDAIAMLRQTVAQAPELAEAHYNLGNALRAGRRFAESVDAFQQSLAIAPHHADATNNLGISLLQVGRLEESIDALRRAIALRPQLPGTHWALAWALLLNGDFGNGWREFEWRLALPDAAPYRRNFPRPRWDGSDLTGRTILLHAEQGLGDTIQFARFATELSRRGGKVVVECQPELLRLLQPLEGVESVIARGSPVPMFDVHCPLLSVPLMLQTRLDSIPARVPYLRADPPTAQKWETRLGDERKLKVGLVWAGSAIHPGDAMRSMRFEHLAPLLNVTSTRFFSLQKTTKPQAVSELIDWTSALTDFAETAGLIANLDLVIAVDTSVAHLAGAMGKRVWVMLPFAPDWRWLRGRDDSPWYPTMKLFRQQAFGDWDSVVARVRAALESLSDATLASQ